MKTAQFRARGCSVSRRPLSLIESIDTRHFVALAERVMLLGMNDPALELREVSDRTWRDFASGVLHPARAAPVVEHWRRAISLGASLEGPSSEEYLLRDGALKEHLERTELVQHLAAAHLERAASDVSSHNYVLLLADALGVVVSASGGGGFSEQARRVRLIPGASWSEMNRGTNAIGTAIAEQRPVYVRGSAHLARSFHDLVCYAAPIFDADGSLVAVLDATSTFRSADDAIGEAVIRTAKAATHALRDRGFGHAGAAVRRTLTRALHRMLGVTLLVEPPARVTGMNAGARQLLGNAQGRSTLELLGIDMASLIVEGRHGRGLSAEYHGRAYAVRVDPIETFAGRLIALLVFLEPKAELKSSPGGRKLPTAADAGAFSNVFSRDPKLDEALSLARRVADSALPVLLLAETGAGKELVARALHGASRRAQEPFVAVNCGAMAPTLLESELFGYGPAAFTGAERGGRQGLFAAAAGGTIFLDEVAEMPPAMQAALLRVLEDGSYRRVGETSSQHADVRVISATHKDLKAMVDTGSFRRDLFYRLKGAEVTLPPLRERKDRSALAQHLLVALARKRGVQPAPSLAPKVLGLFERYAWPGNVRELNTLLDVSLILVAGGRVIEPEHLPPEFRHSAEAGAAGSDVKPPATDLANAERSIVQRVLSEVGGNVSLASKRLGVARSTLYRMLRRHGL